MRSRRSGMELQRRKRRMSDLLGESNQEEDDDDWRDWSALTEPLLQSIQKLLDTFHDFFAFRGVCRNWRPISGPTPLFLLVRTRSDAHALYDITRRRLFNLELPWKLYSRYTIGYSHDHLITSTPAPSQKPILFNLFSMAGPRLPTAPFPFRRVILSSAPSSPECLVVLFQIGTGKIQYCRVGDRRWKVHNRTRLVKDMIFFGGRLYSLSYTGLLEVVDLVPHPKVTPLEVKIPEFGLSSRGWLLAVSDVELLLVHFSINDEVERSMPGGDWLRRIDVYRWDFARGERAKVTSLGGKALFMGYEGFAASIDADVLGVRGNCIYCIGASKNEWAVFSIEDETVEVVSPTSPDLAMVELWEPPIWVFPTLC